jgi:hypothetical protein
MKFETKTIDDRVVLILGTHHSVSFDRGVDLEQICAGVETLVETTIGVSVFDLVLAVIKEFNSEAGRDSDIRGDAAPSADAQGDLFDREPQEPEGAGTSE